MRKAASMEAVMNVPHLSILLPSQAWLRADIYLDVNPSAPHARATWKEAHEPAAQIIGASLTPVPYLAGSDRDE
jgi:hypothetical protein